MNNIQTDEVLSFVPLLMPLKSLNQLINRTAKLNPNPTVISSIYMTFLKLFIV